MESGKTPQLLHFDAHPDLVVPDISPELLFDRRYLVDELSIENWIIPMCATGLVDHVVWIKQEWARQMPVGRHVINVGVDKEENRLAVDSTLEYYLGEGQVNLAKDLQNPHKITLDVVELNEESSIDIITTNRDIILDVDLDYFSTNNPFWAVYKKAGLYAELRDIYKFTIDEQDLEKSLATRRGQLKYLKEIFTHLEDKKSLDEFPKQNHPLFEKIEYLVKVLADHYDLDQVDFLLIHDAGCTWDTVGLPDHRSSDEEIEQAMERAEKFLTHIPKPTIITISRSTEDDYCPADQVEFIQKQFLEVLERVYGDMVEEKPIYYYQTETMDTL